jgi:hypothetical protein
MLLCLLGDVDLLVAVFGSADDFNDWDWSCIDVVDGFYLILHALEDIFDFR